MGMIASLVAQCALDEKEEGREEGVGNENIKLNKIFITTS